MSDYIDLNLSGQDIKLKVVDNDDGTYSLAVLTDPSIEILVPSLAADNSAPADNTAAVVTYNASSGKKHYLYGIFWSYDADPTGGSIKVEDVSGTVVLGPLPITSAGPGFLQFDPPIVSSLANKAMIITLAAGGGTVQGVLSCRHEVR